MRTLLHSACLTLAALSLLSDPLPLRAEEPKWTDLTSPDQWKGWGKDWTQAGRVSLDPQKPNRLVAEPGKGILVNAPRGRAPDLRSKQTFGDVEVHVEFLIAMRSNSGVKLMGLYEVQILDSFGQTKLTGDSCGGIYPRAEMKPRYHHIDDGTPPRVNAARPAGEWQTLDVVFRAPRFDAEGKKTANARFVKVVLNGRVVQQGVEMKYPTGHAWHNKEVATGPLLLQGDHGPVAFRNVRVRPLAAGGKNGR